MNVIKFIKKHIKTILVATIIVLIGLVLNFVISIAQEATIESTFDEMEQIGAQYHSLIVNTLKKTQNDLTLLSKAIVQNDVNSDDIVDFFSTQSHTSELKNLHYIKLNGSGTSVDDKHFDFSNHESFLHAANNNVYIENPHISPETLDIVFDVAVPVVKNEQPIAVLYCEVSVEDFFDTIQKNNNYEGDVFFIDNSLNIVFSTSFNHVNSIAIPERDLMAMGVDNVIKAQTDIINNQNGGFYYDYYGIPKVMVYYPIEPTTVALAMNVNIESISSEIIKATDYFSIAGSIVYWAMVALVIYVSFIQNRSNKKILQLAYYDSLTELPNLTKLRMEMESTLSLSKHKEYTIIVFDIENFKAINEIFGYEMGDRVLQAFKTIHDLLDEPSLITARIGDDKFAMFFETDAFEGFIALVMKVVELYDQVLPELKDYAGTFKLGRYQIEKGEVDIDDIMSKVHLAHNKAKSTKGEAICDYDETFKEQLQKEAEITNKMYGALENKEFKVFLQPKFNISENKLIGAEALVRWIEADGSMNFPNDFIPLFERNGFIVDLDKYIFEQVCITLRRWIDSGLGAITISINCSRLNLTNLHFVSTAVEIADKYNVPHECIEVELTESTTIESYLSIEHLFKDLHENGFKISIDDFGAGQSSLGMLKNLTVDTLKMDRSFFVDGKNARRNDMLIESVVKMAHNLGMYVVAEGIETAEQIELLRSVNCDAVQGYFYDRPMPISTFEEKYRDAMVELLLNDKNVTPLINNINDIKFASSFVPSGIIVTKADEHFTLLEANDYFFVMIGYTRVEVRDLFDNKGINIMLPESQAEILNYFNEQMQVDPSGPMEFSTKFFLKSGEAHIFRLNGKLAINENGEACIYASVIDISNSN